MWGRVIGFGASFVAVVIAVGQGFLWLQDQASREVVLSATALVLVLVAIVTAVLVNKTEGYPSNPTRRQTFRRLARLTALVVAVALAVIATTATQYAAIAVALSVPTWALYEWDRSRYKTCQDCLESVNRHARVCKHCGFRFEPPATPS